MEIPSQDGIKSPSLCPGSDPNIDKKLKMDILKKSKRKKPSIGRRQKKAVKIILLYKEILAIVLYKEILAKKKKYHLIYVHKILQISISLGQ